MNQSLMFFIPLYTTKVVDWNRKKLELLAMDRNLQTVENMTTDYFSGNSTHLNQQFENVMRDEFEEFKAHCGISKYSVTESWMQVSERGNHHPVHSHGSLGFSGVIFLEYDPALHKPTSFFSPFKNFITGKDLFYTPDGIEEGSMIFFPSVIGHFATPNTSDKLRKIVSFNLRVE